MSRNGEKPSHFAKRKYCSFQCYRSSPISEATRLKMSIAHKENPARYWLGKKQPKAMCDKKAEKMLGNTHLLGKTWEVLSRRVPFKPLAYFLRGTTRMVKWRDSIYERDNWTCRECGVRGGKLNADHIKAFSTMLLEHKITTIEEAYACKELWNINNGRTLCVDCHRKTDTFAGRANRLNKLKVEYF